MEKFGFSGLWSHVGSTVLAAVFPIADSLLSYLNVIALPPWAHAVVGVASAVLLFYKGKVVQAPQLVP